MATPTATVPSSPAPDAAAQQQQPAPQLPLSKRERGYVKAVLSGDTLVVVTPLDPNTERILGLSSLVAPKLNRGDEPSEDWALESREFLRKSVLGQKIYFFVDYKPQAGSREYATVYMVGSTLEQTDCLNHVILSEGWASVKAQNPNRKNKDTIEVLEKFQETARAANKGIHAKGKYTPPPEPTESLYNQLKGKVVNAVVEQVRSGTAVRVTLFPSRHSFVLFLSGALAPVFRKDHPEPFAKEAKQYVEQHILQRDVQLVLDGLAPPPPGLAKDAPAPAEKAVSFSGSIEYEGHDIAEELLKNGFARYNPKTAALRSVEWVTRLKAAEKSAQERRLRLQADFKPKAEDVPTEFTAKITAVLNTLALTAVPDNGGREIQVNFSGLRLPRPSFPGDEEADQKNQDKVQVEKDRFERYWASEAKELLRKKLIGQKAVRVVLDYVRRPPKREGEREAPEKSYYSVYANDHNLAVVLVESGLAYVASGRPGEERPADYEVLLMAESKAKQNRKGLHMPLDKLAPKRISDLSVDDSKNRNTQLAKLKPHEQSFKRAGQVKAIIEYVFSGSRFKVYVPKLTTIFIFSLSGIRVPRIGESELNDDVSNQALQFSRERLHQYEVTIEVLGIDRGGNFIGSLFLGKKNFAVLLLENGFASLLSLSASELKDSADMAAAEAAAKSKNLGIWRDYDPVEEEKKRLAREAELEAQVNEAKGAGSSNSAADVVVTEVVDGTRFYYQAFGPETAGLDELVNSLTELSVGEGSAAPALHVKNGDLVRGQFGEDQRWYRAKVLQINGDKYKLQYIDYGNTEIVPASRVRALPATFHQLPSQARYAGLAFVKPLSDESAEYLQDARAYLRELVDGKKLSATTEYRDNGDPFLTLRDPVDNFSITQELIRSGLARLDRSRRRRNSTHPTYLALKAEEEKAKAAHVGIWQYGDIPDSDEDEGPSVKPRPGAPAAAGKEAAAPAAAPATGKKK